MFKNLLGSTLLVLLLWSTSVLAGTTQSSLVINKVAPEGSGVLISFTVQPSDCATSYKGTHAYLAATIKDFDALYLVVSTAQVTGRQVTIYYADNGDCSSLAQLLSLTNVVVN